MTLKTNPNTAKYLLECNIPRSVLVKFHSSGLWPSTFGPITLQISEDFTAFETRDNIRLATQCHTVEDWVLQPDSRSPGKRNPIRYGTWKIFPVSKSPSQDRILRHLKPVDTISGYFFKIHSNVIITSVLFDTNKERGCGLVSNTPASS